MLAGPFSGLLASTLPFHNLQVESTGAILLAVITAPATYAALAVVALGLIAWWQRENLRFISEPLRGVGRIAAESFGFEAINRWVVAQVSAAAESLSALQTGQLNWNILGIVAGLAVVLLILALGAK